MSPRADQVVFWVSVGIIAVALAVMVYLLVAQP